MRVSKCLLNMTTELLPTILSTTPRVEGRGAADRHLTPLSTPDLSQQTDLVTCDLRPACLSDAHTPAVFPEAVGALRTSLNS